MVDAVYRFQRIVHARKIEETVVDGYDAGNAGLFCLLNDAELLNRVIIDQPDVGVSIKKLHGISPINKNFRKTYVFESTRSESEIYRCYCFYKDTTAFA